MRLTEKQRQRINRYLREVHDRLAGFEEPEREKALRQLKDRIQRELLQYGRKEIHDADIETVLAQCGSPSEQAAGLTGRPVAHSSVAAPAASDRVWLGVCGTLGARWDLEPRVLRILMVVLGFVPFLLPFVLIAYIGAYLYLYFETPAPSGASPLDVRAVVTSVLKTFGIALALFIGSKVLLEIVARLAFRLFEQSARLDPRWTWLDTHGNAVFFWAVTTLLPLSALSALPVPSAWAGTLRKATLAGLALYAVLLCLGLAYFLTGTLLLAADHVARTTGLLSLF